MCHGGLWDAADNDVSIDSHWRSTMMANGAKDPLWQAKVASEVARHPNLAGMIEDKCATCHMPMARTQAVSDGSMVAMSGDGFLSGDNPLSNAAMDGISCTVCHQIQDLALGEKASFSGEYPVDTSTEPPNRLVFGPFSQPEQELMQATVGYTPVQGLQTKDSGLCATCHTLYTPYVDSRGNVLGTFPEQTVYLEWEHSDFGDGAPQERSCQQCHMPAADGPVVISLFPVGLDAREPFARHHFVGGNFFMLKVLRNDPEKLGLTSSTGMLTDTLARTLDQLQGDTADLSIGEAVVSEDTLTVSVRVENRAGHKFPSGFPSRRAWIHFSLSDGTGETVFESGRPNDGRIIGVDADEDSAAFEPHHLEVSSPDQVQVYESMMVNSDEEVTYTLLRGARYIKDNRLLPQGFDKATADEDITVRGQDDGDSNFVAGSDEVTYRIDISEFQGPYTVRAELLFHPVSFGFVRDLRGDNSTLIRRFARYYDNIDKSPVTVSVATVDVR